MRLDTFRRMDLFDHRIRQLERTEQVGGGDPGPPGPEGPEGPQGDPGPAGADGAPGATGSTGPAGADSTVPGPQGPAGATGSTGPQGPQGDPGPTGATGQAEQWHAGAGPPAAGLGNVGDFYLQGGGTGLVYEKTGPSTWTPSTNIKGDTGNTGATGATGSQGPQGDPGPQGIQGPQGPAGALGQLGYAQITANQSGITTEVDITGLSVTVTVAAGRRLKISCMHHLVSSIVNDRMIVSIKESTTTLGRSDNSLEIVNIVQSHFLAVMVSPSAGSHTYKISAQRAAGTGTCQVVGDASGRHTWIMVEDVGVA